MKKIISFDKNLEFNSMIGDISAISLDNNLSFNDNHNISGNLLVSGSYKLTEASRLEDSFEFKIPVDIIINENLDIDNSTIEIEDFTYEVLNDDTLVCHIEIKIEGVENIDIEEDRECDDDIKTNIVNDPSDDIKEIEMTTDDVDTDVNDENESLETTNVGSLFSLLSDSDDTFSTYSIYIKRKDESLESIMSKYKITKEDLEDYNDLESIDIGSKIVIPSSNEDS